MLATTRRKRFLSEVSFDSLQLHPDTLRALEEEFKYERLSVPQSHFIPALVSSPDLDAFVKATTGSGKTLGFLLPAIEAMFGPPPAEFGSSVLSLVLSPSRELAVQTCNEAIRLMTFHGKRDSRVNASVVIGGTDRAKNIRSLTKTPPALLVATPGRLEDLLTDAVVRKNVLASTRVVVLDEADRLLDMGFVPAIRRILSMGPVYPNRRLLMLSATVEEAVLDIAKRFMRPGYAFIDTVALARAALTETQRARVEKQNSDQSHISQIAIVAPPEKVHLTLHRVLTTRRAVDPQNHKVLVFFPSNAMVEFYAELFRRVFGVPVLMLTGGMPQRKREEASEGFRKRSGVTLFASDVAGRGMDFPAVTCVVQVGVVKNDVYKQRVGRTGRGGASGEGVLILGSDERKVLDTLQRTFPIREENESRRDTESKRATAVLDAPLQRLASAAFRGTLGAYNSELRVLGWTKQQLVDAIVARFRGVGLSRIPEISDKTLGKMGLAGVKIPSQ